jgi:hypothetical protein
VTTTLMLGPALVSIVAGTLLAPHRVVADIVFVAATMVAVYVRRFGARGFGLGMAVFMPLFLTQFLHVNVAQLPWLLVAAAVGIGSTLLLRGWAFAERPERTLDRLVRAFRAHLHAFVEAVADVLAAQPPVVEDKLRAAQRRRTRLNSTALLLADRLEQRGADRPNGSERDDGDGEDLALGIVDAELAAERLAVAIERLVQALCWRGCMASGRPRSPAPRRRWSPRCSTRQREASPRWRQRPWDTGTALSGRPSH